MSAPMHIIKPNQEDSHQRSPSYCVVFLRYTEPCAMHITDETQAFTIKDIFIVENDCVNVSISNTKSSFGKVASLTMKTGEIWYQNAINPGDWCLIWAADHQEPIDKIIASLRGKDKKSLNDFNSGLKFIGRVNNLSSAYTVAANGYISIQQNISCQAFTEMANSIYFTFLSESIITQEGTNSRGSQEFLEGTFNQIVADATGLSARENKKQQIIEKYGRIVNGTWPNQNQWLANFEVPKDLNFVLENGISAKNASAFTVDPATKRVTHFKINKDILPQLNDAIDQLRKAGKLEEWKEVRATFAVRDVAGEAGKISTHSYGLAIDINPTTNGWGKKPSLSEEFCKSFTSSGWTWGGNFNKPDGMHFSIAWENIPISARNKAIDATDAQDAETFSEENEDITSEVAPANEIKKSGNSVDKKSSKETGFSKSVSLLADSFINAQANALGQTPETTIAILFTIFMGVDKEKSLANALADQDIKGQFGEGVGIPKELANILGRPKATKLWQLYTVILGLQKYANASQQSYKNFFPVLDEKSSNLVDAVFYRTNTRTKGFIPFSIPPVWDNNSLWNILNQFLNDAVNEMYTCLRVNKDNKIMPTLVIREQPYSTNLYDYLIKQAAKFKKEKASKNKKTSDKVKEEMIRTAEEAFIYGSGPISELTPVQATVLRDLKERTFYNNLPRWVIHDGMVRSYQIANSESKRINFVQVWGRNRLNEMTDTPGISQEDYKQMQFSLGNYVADEIDISRHGLRAYLNENAFDKFESAQGTLSVKFARMRADWMFNGHLKPEGSISCNGIVEPICEGDNVLFKGILFHIEGVSHNVGIGSNGQKFFYTTIQVSNGILASSLDSKNGIPEYVLSKGGLRSDLETFLSLGGSIDVQATGPEKKRGEDGERN